MSELKEGTKYDTAKAKWYLLPGVALQGLVNLYTIGSQKYAERNWEKGISYCRVFGAMMRHAWDWFALRHEYDSECFNAACRKKIPGGTEDPSVSCPYCGDATIRSHHMDAVAWNAFALRTFVARNMIEFDDRPKENN